MDDVSDNEHRGWWRHRHARHMPGCHWCEQDAADSQPPIDDTPLVYGPKEHTWFDEAGAMRRARHFTVDGVMSQWEIDQVRSLQLDSDSRLRPSPST